MGRKTNRIEKLHGTIEKNFYVNTMYTTILLDDNLVKLTI